MTPKEKSGTAQQIVTQIMFGDHWLERSEIFRPIGDDFLSPFIAVQPQKKLTDLEEQVNRSYDLTVTAAMDLQIPVVGSGSGGFSRRVIVMERAAFYKVLPKDENDSEKHYGYAIRLCVTVNKWQAGSKVSLPFLAASAQLGNIDAQWSLQVRGLQGKAMDQAILPPTELTVETFILAKQSLEKIIEAIQDVSTIFTPTLIAEVRPVNLFEIELRRSMVRAFAVTSLERGRSLAEAQDRLGYGDPDIQDAMRDVYETFAGNDPNQKPNAEARKKAGEIAGRLRADIPFFGQ